MAQKEWKREEMKQNQGRTEQNQRKKVQKKTGYRAVLAASMFLIAASAALSACKKSPAAETTAQTQAAEETDGAVSTALGAADRVLVDKLWPRGIKKEWLKYDYWAKDITPSAALRRWFHEDIPGHWNDFVVMYQKELEASQAVADFLTLIKPHPVITLLYASKEPVYNHARILRDYLEMHLKE